MDKIKHDNVFKEDEKKENQAKTVYFKLAELDEMRGICEKENIKLHALMQYGIRHFLAGYKRGEFKLQKKRVSILDTNFQ